MASRPFWGWEVGAIVEVGEKWEESARAPDGGGEGEVKNPQAMSAIRQITVSDRWDQGGIHTVFDS